MLSRQHKLTQTAQPKHCTKTNWVAKTGIEYSCRSKIRVISNQYIEPVSQSPCVACVPPSSWLATLCVLQSSSCWTPASQWQPTMFSLTATNTECRTSVLHQKYQNDADVDYFGTDYDILCRQRITRKSHTPSLTHNRDTIQNTTKEHSRDRFCLRTWIERE